MKSYVNKAYTPEDGTHVEAVLKGVTYGIMAYLQKHELTGNRGFVKRIDHGIFKNVSDKLDFECYRFILDGELLYGLFEISGNSCRLSKNY